MNAKDMRLRDYFAAAALQGECAAQGNDNEGTWVKPYTGLAKRCYEMADAMLSQRDAAAQSEQEKP